MILALLIAGTPAQAIDVQTGKERGWEAVAVPVANYFSDLGWGFGVLAFTQVMGDEEPTRERPWLARGGIFLYTTTQGYRNHWARVDVPAIAGSPWRFDIELRWFAWFDARYYGEGNEVRVDRERPDAWYRYEVRGPYLYTNLRRTLDDEWDVIATVGVRYSEPSWEPDSLLAEELPLGVEGGWYNQVGLGLLYDSRDLELDPTSGVFGEISVRVAHEALGSDYRALGVHLTDRRYGTPASWLTLAMRTTLEARRGDVPFYLSADLTGQTPRPLGGAWTLRGLQPAQLRGDVVLLMQPEVRFRAPDVQLRHQRVVFMGTLFADLGRVWLWPDEHFGEDAIRPVRMTLGGGPRVNWHDALILRADIVFGLELYDNGSRGWNPGIYVVGGHPF